MKHLSVDEIIKFVSSNGLGDEEKINIRRVNEHIRSCSKCLEKVQAFQLIYDEFTSLCTHDDFENYVYNKNNSKQITNTIE